MAKKRKNPLTQNKRGSVKLPKGFMTKAITQKLRQLKRASRMK